MSLYRRMLGHERFAALPAAIQHLHEPASTPRARGRCRIERGRSAVSWAVGSVVGLPPAGDDVSVDIAFSAAGDVETWTRHFGTRRLASTQELLGPGAGPRQGRLVE